MSKSAGGILCLLQSKFSYANKLPYKNQPFSSLFFICCRSIDPPNLILEENAKNVDEPHKGDTNKNQNDAKDHTDHIVLIETAANAVQRPDNVESGDSENEFDQLRKIVYRLNNTLHTGYSSYYVFASELAKIIITSPIRFVNI